MSRGVWNWRCIVVAAVSGMYGCAGSSSMPPDPDAGDAAVERRFQREDSFWDMVALCGEAHENYPTVGAMADAADAVVVGKITDVMPGNTVQGDAAEDFYAEANVVVEVTESLRGSIGDSFSLSLILPRVVKRDAIEPALQAMRASLPKDPIVLLVRKRTDFDDLYILVNERGLWTSTARAALDNPIAETRCDGHHGEAVRKAFLGDVQTVDALIEQLRR